MGQPLSEITIVCQQQQAFALRVQASDIEKPRKVGRQQIENFVSGVRIAASRDKTYRLIQNNRQCGLNVDQFAVNFDVIAFIGLSAKIGADLTVNCDPAGGDQFVAFTSGSNPGGGEKTIQPHG
jgi:hypothetical protein